jgi:hypothetical protein
MTVTRASAGKREQLLAFAIDVQSGRKIAAGNAASVAARNQEIAAALAAKKALPERLSPDRRSAGTRAWPRDCRKGRRIGQRA